MSGIQTAQVVNATIYLNGKTLLGRAAEVKLPEITAAMKEHSALGMVGRRISSRRIPFSAALPGNCGAARDATGRPRWSPS